MRGWLTAPTTPPAYAWPARTTGPSVRSMTRLTAFTSSSSVVSGLGAAGTLSPACCRPVPTRLQLDPSAQAPWTSTTVELGYTTQNFRHTADDGQLAEKGPRI